MPNRAYGPAVATSAERFERLGLVEDMITVIRTARVKRSMRSEVERTALHSVELAAVAVSIALIDGRGRWTCRLRLTHTVSSRHLPMEVRPLVSVAARPSILHVKAGTDRERVIRMAKSILDGRRRPGAVPEKGSCQAGERIGDVVPGQSLQVLGSKVPLTLGAWQ